MKKKIGLAFLVIFTFLHVVTCIINLVCQHNTEMNTYWFIFPISGNGICFPLFVFTFILAVVTIYMYTHNKRIQ